MEVGYGEPRESSHSVLAERYRWARDLGRRMQKISMGNELIDLAIGRSRLEEAFADICEFPR